ncbi:MAG: DUF5908 family protein [Flavobacteriaceae bacterium]|nr:DUF5908 family protein [Flavobacteriaceae bacterium]
MPIEIKELHIKINVDEGSSPKEASSSSKNKTNAQKDKTTLIATCVEAVLEILEQQKER